MFIELTDILRCPEPHDEQYLVLVPARMASRSVVSGTLGCPVCHREYQIADGVVHFTPSPARTRPGASPDITAIEAFLGLSGPGGYAGIVGLDAATGEAVARAIPGVHFVGVNPAKGTNELPMVSLVCSGMLPVKSRSLRGVILLGESGSDPHWAADASRAVLPGLRVTGEGNPPAHEGLELLAAAGGWWVAQRR